MYADRIRKVRATLLRKHWAQCKIKGHNYIQSITFTERDIDFAVRHRNVNLVPMINKLYSAAYNHDA